jgi:YbbR domain-containing protein
MCRAMSIEKFIFKNLGLRIVALILAILLWVWIAGKERSYSERTMEVNVEYFNVADNIDIRSINPDKVRLKVRGISRELNKIGSEDIRVRVNMQGIRESTLISFDTKSLLEYPENIEVTPLYPERIWITAAELITREVPIRVRYKGRMKPGIILLSRQWVPEKVKIFGYKSQVMDINTVEAAEWVNLAEIESSQIIRIPLKKEKEILKFVDTDSVEVHITVDNLNKPKSIVQDKNKKREE